MDLSGLDKVPHKGPVHGSLWAGQGSSQRACAWISLGWTRFLTKGLCMDLSGLDKVPLHQSEVQTNPVST